MTTQRPLDVEVVHIAGRSYRKPRVVLRAETDVRASTSTDSPLLMDEDEGLCAIRRDPATGGFSLSLKVPAVFHKFLVGKKGAMRNRIQHDTGASLVIPRPNSLDDTVVLQGPSEASVASAKTRVELLVESATANMPATHFLSLPLTHATMKESLELFLRKAQETCAGARGFDTNLCIDVNHFHLTLLMLHLYSPEKIRMAERILKECSSRIYDLFGTRSAVVRVQGLECMNDDPGEVSVVYAQIAENETRNKIYTLWELLVCEFRAAGLLPPREERDLKLHATLFNSSWQGSDCKTCFDARPLLNALGDHDFGECRIPALHLSQRGSYGEDLYYECVAAIPLP